MEQLKKKDLLKHAKNEYLGAMLAAKVARMLSGGADDGSDAEAASAGARSRTPPRRCCSTRSKGSRRGWIPCRHRPRIR